MDHTRKFTSIDKAKETTSTEISIRTIDIIKEKSVKRVLEIQFKRTKELKDAKSYNDDEKQLKLEEIKLLEQKLSKLDFKYINNNIDGQKENVAALDQSQEKVKKEYRFKIKGVIKEIKKAKYNKKELINVLEKHKINLKGILEFIREHSKERSEKFDTTKTEFKKLFLN
jgi:hypothetical protein